MDTFAATIKFSMNMPPFNCLLEAKLYAIEMHCSGAQAAAQIPDVVWGALIAGGISLLTVVATLVTNAWLQREKMRQESTQHAQKLDHEVTLNQQKLDSDGIEKGRDRLHTLRREVYLPAVAASSKIPVLIGKLALPSTDDLILSQEVAQEMTVVGRIAAVGSLELTELVVEYTVAAGKMLAAMQQLRPPLMVANSNLLHFQEQLRRADDAVGSAYQEFGALRRRGGRPEELDSLRVEIEHTENMQRFWRAEMKKANLALWRAQLALMTEIRNQMERFAPLMPKLIAALRSDIALRTDEDRLEEIYGRARSQALKIFSDSIEMLESLIARAELDSAVADQ